MDDEIKELTLLLLYLTSWQEDVGIAKVQRSWKGYPFKVLNELLTMDISMGVLVQNLYI